jgi:hypothetical protein
MAQLFDYDPFTKKKQLFHWDETEETAILETLQDVTPIVELSKAEYAAMDERAPWKRDFNLGARIPMTVVSELMASGVWYDNDALKKWLNDSNNRAFRTRPGRI